MKNLPVRIRNAKVLNRQKPHTETSFQSVGLKQRTVNERNIFKLVDNN